MDKEAKFNLSLNFLDKAAAAELGDEYTNPLLSPVELVFTDDQPNANSQGISQDEFDNLLRSMKFMPIKANFDSEAGLGGHADATIIGLIKNGVRDGNKLVAQGALYKDEYPNIIDYFKSEVNEGRAIDFSWEIRYREAEVADDVEWLKDTTTKAITAVQDPAYEGRTSLLTISSTWLKCLPTKELKELELALAEEVANHDDE